MDDWEVRDVKGITILALILLAGCAGHIPLEQLEAQALITGDWSAVQKRERAIARRNSHSNMHCPPGTMGFCENRFGDMSCSCAESEMVRAFFRQD